MSNYDFAHLHVHSHGSLLDGFSKPEEYIEAALKNGQKSLGLTDHGNNFLTYEFIKSANDKGIRPIPGCEFYVAPQNPEGAFCQERVFYGTPSQKKDDVSANGAYLHLTVWAINNTGLNNLFKLSTLSYDPNRQFMNTKKPRIDFDLLAEYSEGLVVSTGCPSSEVSTRLRLGQEKEAYEYASRLKDVFGDRLFVEIMDHKMTIDLEKSLLPQQMELSRKLGIPLLATNDAHYAYKDNAKPHEEMLALQTGSKMSELPYDEDGGTRFAFNGSGYYLKSSEEMYHLFPDHDFPNANKNTLLIAEMASDIKMQYNPHLKPTPFIPEGFDSSYSYYRHLIKKGLKERYGNHPAHIKEEAMRRAKYEMEVIYSSDFVDYMLVVESYLNWSKEKFSTRNSEGKIMASSIGAGRGSVGGSIHAYCLGISEVDPIRFGLFFERFLSAGRGPEYMIEFNDGSLEKHVASNSFLAQKNKEEREKMYVHQLSVGDTVYYEQEHC